MIHTIKLIIDKNGYYICGDCDNIVSTWSMMRKDRFKYFSAIVEKRFQHKPHDNKHRKMYEGRHFRLLALVGLIRFPPCGGG
jgi:hypothetical protein